MAVDRRSAAARRAQDPQREASLGLAADGICALHVGEPCFDTPATIVEVSYQAARDGYTRYPPPLGDHELRETIATRLTRLHGHAVSASQVVITAGSTAAISATLLACLDEGDEAVLLDPAYSAYAPLIRQAGARPRRVPPRDETFALDCDALAAAVTPRTKLLLFNNPVNPTGMVYPRAVLEAVAEIVSRHDLLVVADEVYDRLLFGGARFTSVLDIPQLRERTIYINSFSKTYAMTGWRVGYLAAPPELLAGPATLHRASANGVNWPAQRAALAALGLDPAVVESMRTAYAARLRALTTALGEIPGACYPVPQGAFYVFARFAQAGSLSSAELTSALREAGVAVRSGSEFGPAGEGYIRLSYSTGFDDIEQGVAIIKNFMEEITETRPLVDRPGGNSAILSQGDVR
jgi:aspartate aminotransferase